MHPSLRECNKNEFALKNRAESKTERLVTSNEGIGVTRFSDFLVLQRFMPASPRSVHLKG